MNIIKSWWQNELPQEVKFVFLVLLANGLPAFLILMSVPKMTEILFVWTIKPVINARLIGVMYSNALILVALGALQTTWARARVTMVVITLFSLLATILTFFFLKPFLAHPWYHLAFWLTMYLILFFAAPYVFVVQEKKSGGRLPVQVPLTAGARSVAVLSGLISLFSALGLIFNIELVNQYWPWTLPPLVGGLIGVLFFTHAAAFAWALWDGDWIRTRPIYWQAPLTGLLFILLPLLHSGDLRSDAGSALVLYYSLAGLISVANLGTAFFYRTAEKRISNEK